MWSDVVLVGVFLVVFAVLVCGVVFFLMRKWSE